MISTSVKIGCKCYERTAGVSSDLNAARAAGDNLQTDLGMVIKRPPCWQCIALQVTVIQLSAVKMV